MMQDDDGGLVEAIAAVIREADIYDPFEQTASEVLSAIEREGYVIVKKRDGQNAARWYVENFPV